MEWVLLCHFTDDKTDSGRLSDLLKVTPFGSDEVGTGAPMPTVSPKLAVPEGPAQAQTH